MRLVARSKTVAAGLALACITVGPAFGASAKTIPGLGTRPFLKYGRIEARPYINYSGTYNDAMLLQPGVVGNTFIDMIAPGVAVNLGQRFSFNYSPTFIWYSNGLFRDTVAHAFSGSGALTGSRWNLSLTQNYGYTAAPRVETGRQTDIETVGTQLNAAVRISQKLQLTGSIDQNLTFVAQAPDFHDWSATGNVVIQLAERVSVSLRGRTGYSAIYKSPDMVYAQPGGQVSWSPLDRLSFSGGVSFDYRATLLRRWRWRGNPLYSASVRYEPTKTTRVQGSVNQTTSPSLFAGQTVNSTSWIVTVDQRFLKHLWFSAGLDYQNSKYQTNGRATDIRRNDNVWRYTSGVRTTVLRKIALSLTYEDSENNSNIDAFALRSHQIVWTVGYRY